MFVANKPVPKPPVKNGMATRLRRLRRSPLLSRRLWLRRLAFWGGAIAVSLAAIAFARAADGADLVLHRIMAANRFAILALAPLGLALSAWLTLRVFPGAGGSGIPQVIAALEMRDQARVSAMLSPRIALGKVLLTLLGLASGASIGREGPTVQVSASVMQALGRALDLPRELEQRALVLAGGAAGIAAAFNTPLAGIVFAIEELSRSFEQRTSGVVLTAVIIAGVTTTALVGNVTYFGTSPAMLPFGAAWVAVLACGVAGGLAGGLFSSALVRAALGIPGRVGAWAHRHPIIFAGLCGLGVAGLGLASHGATYGTGYAQARAMLAGQSNLPWLFFLLKLAATTLSYCSGIPGGIFAPSLAIGAGLGRSIAELLPAAPAGAVVMLGMVAYFSGVVQAPITAAVIVMEMADNQAMTIPLMATSFLAFGCSRLVCRHALYGALAGIEKRRAPALA